MTPVTNDGGISAKRQILRDDTMSEESLVENDSLFDEHCDEKTVSDPSSVSVNSVPPDPKYNAFNFAYTNARSLPAKITSMIEGFRQLDLHLLTVSETWLKSSRQTTSNLDDMRSSENIGSLVRNRPGRGGGVGIFYDINRVAMKAAYPFPAGFEAIVGVGKTIRDRRKVAVFSIYLPPKMEKSKLARFNELLRDRIARAKEDLKDPYVIIAGDLNKKDIGGALVDFPDIAPLPTGPTRGNATLDCCFTNIRLDRTEISSCDPLYDAEGNKSDHLLMQVACRLVRGDHFTKSTFLSRQYSRKGEEEFGRLLELTDWSEILGGEPSEMVAKMDERLLEYMDACFPEKTITRKSSDKPWFTKRLASLVRKKKRWFKRRNKDRGWHNFSKYVAKEIAMAKERFVHKIKDSLIEGGNTGSFFRATRALQTEEVTPEWNIRNLFPGKSDAEVAGEAARYFNAISKEFAPVGDPPPTDVADQLNPPTEQQIATKIRKMKKPKGRVRGDIDRRLLGKYANWLAIPLAAIYSQVYQRNSWPQQWKTETVSLIPKKTAPESLADIRNISCTPFFSKVLESFVLDDLKECIELSSNQYGGKKGQGVDHLLIEMWDFIHRSLEDPGTAVGITAIDFHKAFNRMSHSACLEALERLGGKVHSINLVNSFLHGRRMQVKVNGVLSPELAVDGGAPQGSIMGGFLFCATIDGLLEQGDRQQPNTPPIIQDDDRVDVLVDDLMEWEEGNESDDDDDPAPFFRWRNNPLDDSVRSYMATQQVIDQELGIHDGWAPSRPVVVGYVDDISVLEKLRLRDSIRHFSQNKTTAAVHAPDTEEIFDDIGNVTTAIGMQINPDKTQLLCISGATDAEASSYINVGEKRLKSGDSLKVLGFCFDRRPGVHRQIQNLLRRGRSRLWALYKLRDTGLTQADLQKIYCTTIRTIVDYTIPTYHSQLTQELSDALEQFQATAMKIVYGHRVSYRTVVEHGLIETHKTRRARIFRNFTMKASRSGFFRGRWFPPNENVDYNTRHRKYFKEERPKTSRLAKSPIFAMRRLLNENENRLHA